MTPQAPSPSSSPPTTAPAASPEQPIYGGNTTPGRISMSNGHQLASARRRPDGTILVHTLSTPPCGGSASPSTAAHCCAAWRCCPPRSATPSPCCAWNTPPTSTPTRGHPSPPRPPTANSMPRSWQ